MSLHYIFQVTIILVVITAILYGGLSLLKMLPGGKKFTNKRLKRLDYLALEYQTGIHLIAVDDKEYLVGVGKVHSIQPINKAVSKKIDLKKIKETI